MAIEIEGKGQLEVRGLDTTGMVEIPGANPRKCSYLIKLGELAVFVKSVDPLERMGITAFEAAKRMEGAESVASSELSDLVPPYEYAVLQGILTRPDGTTEVVAMAARFSPWMDNVTTTSEMSLKEVFGDEDILIALLQISRFTLSHIFSENRDYDFISGKGLRWRNAPFPICLLLQTLVSQNLMVGTDPKTGERKIFCDADWYRELSESAWDPLIIKTGLGSICVKNIVFYAAALGYHRLKRLFRRS